MEFLPALNKLEAVARISNLTNSGPEVLGPGSKEHKSVFINLAKGLNISFADSETKQGLAKKIATTVGEEWLDSYQSIGQTITLQGLNLLLLASSRFLEKRNGWHPERADMSFETELRLISQVIVNTTPESMNGYACVQEMRDAEHKEWRQTEWQGWYFQMKAEAALISQIGGGRAKFFNTNFDYVRNFIWDLKAHSNSNRAGKPNNSTYLNDCRAMEEAIEQSGLGFIILNGNPIYDLKFTQWHKEFRGGGSGESRRKLKSNFTPNSLNIFYVDNSNHFESYIKQGLFSRKKQGKNSNGKPRPDKYHLNIANAINSDLQVFSHSFS